MAGAPRQPTSTDEELFAAERESVLALRSDRERIELIGQELAYGFDGALRHRPGRVGVRVGADGHRRGSCL